MKRTLSLREEALAELTGAEAAMVAAGALSGPTCLHATCDGPCNSDLVQCVTYRTCVSVVEGACQLTVRGC